MKLFYTFSTLVSFVGLFIFFVHSLFDHCVYAPTEYQKLADFRALSDSTMSTEITQVFTIKNNNKHGLDISSIYSYTVNQEQYEGKVDRMGLITEISENSSYMVHYLKDNPSESKLFLNTRINKAWKRLPKNNIFPIILFSVGSIVCVFIIFQLINGIIKMFISDKET